jgi:hypothetical protein
MPTHPREERDPSGTDVRLEPAATALPQPSPDASRATGARRTTRERAEDQRREKLELVRQQVKSGSLVIRQMTPEERRCHPPRAARPTQVRAR